MSKAERRFVRALDEIESAAREVGMSNRQLAAEASVSPATLGRWRKKPPATILTLAKMEKAVAAKKRRR